MKLRFVPNKIFDKMKTLRQFIKQILVEWQSFTPVSMPTAMRNHGNLYFGTSNISTNTPGIEHLPEKRFLSALCFIQREDGKILGVSRKDNHNSWGLPGGKVEQNETIEDAAKRELKEETGLNAIALRSVLTQIDDNQFEVTTFICDVENTNDVHSSEEGKVKWITWNELLNGPFAKYHSQLQNALGQ